MSQYTEQMNEWCAGFGKEYTDRNTLSTSELNGVYEGLLGVTRTELNAIFVGNMDRNIKILEVGSNIGAQLVCLQEMGFKNLYGVEVNPYAVERSKQMIENINIIQGSALDLPFKDGYFDLVFTSVALIHIAPADINRALREIHRCSNDYIWGYEYYADEYTSVTYRGRENLLWKTNFAKQYCDSFNDLKILKARKFKHMDNSGNIDEMFLVRKV